MPISLSDCIIRDPTRHVTLAVCWMKMIEVAKSKNLTDQVIYAFSPFQNPEDALGSGRREQNS